MRRRFIAGVATALVAVSVACNSDKSADSAKTKDSVTDAAPAGAQAEGPDSVGIVSAAKAIPLPATGVGAPAVESPHPAAPAPVISGAASTRPVTTRVSAPRRVMLGDVDLTGIGYDVGRATARVVMIDFSDFGCPYCAQFTRETYPAIEREYVKTGKVFFKYVPFIVGMFPHAREATRAVECTADQGRFWPMADHVYEVQKYWKRGGDPVPLLMAIADVVGADTSKVSQCYRDGRTDARTTRANDVASTIGVRVTPSFIVQERPIQGALSLADFRKVIDAALLLEGAKQ